MAASNVTNSPVYTRLIDDSSPLLFFDPTSAWNHTAEDGPDLYVNSTYSSSDVSGATCTFSFNGTGFSVLGARKPNYGEYLILLDGGVQQFSNATAHQTEFGQVLGGASGLEDGLHTVVFMAAGGGPVDIDAIVYERTDKEESSEATSFPSSSSSETSSVPSSSSSQTASTPTPTSGNRISANPYVSRFSLSVSLVHAQDPNESAPSQNASAAPVPSSSSVPPSASSQSSSVVSSATASSESSDVPLSSQPNAQPSGESTVTAHQGAQPTAQPGPSGPTRSSTSSALGPSVSQAEQANSPQIAGTSQPQKGLPTGAIVGICLGLAAALLLIVALLFCLMRRRRRAATARRRMTAGLPSPTLPLQDPSRHASYFFGGRGNNTNVGPNGGNGMRELYLAQGPQNSVTMQGRTHPDTLKPMGPAVIRDSVHSNSDTATLASEDRYITDASSIRTIPTRPPRPPNVRLSIV
ncbi:hypothetical protein V8D89_006130 [Ganoderma adspersum]